MKPAFPKGLNAFHILALRIGPNDAEAYSIGDYLQALLSELWLTGAAFDPIYPFGKPSDWQQPVITALRRVDPSIDRVRTDEIVTEAMKVLFKTVVEKTAIMPPIG